MKVLLAATGSETFSGAYKCLIDLALGLIRKNVQVTITLPRDESDIKEELEYYHLPYVVFPEKRCWYVENEDIAIKTHIENRVKRFINKRTIKNIRNYLKENDFDIVHVNASTAYIVGYAAIQLQIPVVWHLREMLEEDLNIKFFDPSYSYRILNKASRCIAISHAVKDKWQKKLNVPIDVVYDGIFINDYYVKDKEFRNPIKVLIYGRIVPGKGQLFFIKGVNKALKQIKVPVQFLIAGKIEDEVYFNECNKYVEEHQLHKYIKYIGEINEVKELLAQAHIVCVCSTMEGFGRVTVESMLGKCLVIGANTGATKEIICNNENGLLYAYNDLIDFSMKLAYAVNNFEQYKFLIETSQKSAIENYSVTNNIKRIYEIYTEVLKVRIDK